MKKLFVLVCLLTAGSPLFAKVLIGSWNLANFGDKKSAASIAIMAQALKDFDVVAVQEVLTSPGGARAVARLADELNRTGSAWQYTISDPTTSDNVQERERYAFLWKPSRVKLMGKATLADSFGSPICREPYMATFACGNREFTLVNFHALPKKKQPEHEIELLQTLVACFPGKKLILLGDFNCPATSAAFDPLRSARFTPALIAQRTTLKQECKAAQCLASEYDNIFYSKGQFHLRRGGIIPFHTPFNFDMRAARKVSDHLPVFAEIE